MKNTLRAGAILAFMFCLCMNSLMAEETTITLEWGHSFKYDPSTYPPSFTSTGDLVCVLGKSTIALSKSGEQAWEISTKDSHDIKGPVVDADDVVYHSLSSGVAAITMAGRDRWRQPNSAFDFRTHKTFPIIDTIPGDAGDNETLHCFANNYGDKGAFFLTLNRRNGEVLKRVAFKETFLNALAIDHDGNFLAVSTADEYKSEDKKPTYPNTLHVLDKKFSTIATVPLGEEVFSNGVERECRIIPAGGGMIVIWLRNYVVEPAPGSDYYKGDPLPYGRLVFVSPDLQIQASFDSAGPEVIDEMGRIYCVAKGTLENDKIAHQIEIRSPLGQPGPKVVFRDADVPMLSTLFIDKNESVCFLSTNGLIAINPDGTWTQQPYDPPKKIESPANNRLSDSRYTPAFHQSGRIAIMDREPTVWSFATNGGGLSSNAIWPSPLGDEKRTQTCLLQKSGGKSTVSWGDIDGAEQYHIVVADVDNNIVYENANIKEPFVDLDGKFDASGINFWKVRAGDGEEWGEWSENYPVTAAAIPTPTQVVPDFNYMHPVIGDSAMVVRALSRGRLTPDQYDFSITNAGGEIVRSRQQDKFDWRLDGDALPPGRYTAAARVGNANGWSEPVRQEFVVFPPPQDLKVRNRNSGEQAYSWSPVEGAESYQFELVDSTGKVVDKCVTEDTEITRSLVRTPGESYRWRVSAGNEFGVGASSPFTALTFLAAPKAKQ